eukprot:134623_1
MSFAALDAKRYREGYKKDTANNKRQRLNIDFFENKIPSRPQGAYIDVIHSEWFGRHTLLERNHSYIQWLFPIREDGLNFSAQKLLPHEIDHLKSHPELLERLIKSYKLMLDFYGMTLVDRETGRISRADNFRARYAHLSHSFHNYLRITRILKCLGELGFEHYKPHFLDHVLNEMNEGNLSNCFQSCVDYWIPVIRNDETRAQLTKRARRISLSAHFRGGRVFDGPDSEDPDDSANENKFDINSNCPEKSSSSTSVTENHQNTEPGDSIDSSSRISGQFKITDFFQDSTNRPDHKI